MNHKAKIASLKYKSMRLLMFKLFLLCFLSSISLFGQRNDFSFGIQVGNNFSQTIINNEFANSPLRSDFFIGSSFGFVARSKLFSYKWDWGGFSQRFKVYAEYGFTATYSGYNYRFNEQTTFQKQFTYAMPLLLVVRPAFHKYWYKSFKGKRLFPIVKSGFTLSKISNHPTQNSYAFDNAILEENINSNQKIHLAYVGAFGMQKEYKNGRIMYIGFSVHMPFSASTKGIIKVDSPQINEIATIAKQGNFYSIDLQYFIGKRRNRRGRNNKRYRLPKIIYNPRYIE